MSGKHLVFTFVLAACQLAYAAAACHAQRATAAPERYVDVVREALREYDAGNFVEARTLFERAHALKPSARTLRGLGICSYELKHYIQAVSELQAALTDPRNPLTEEQRADASATLEKAQRFVGSIVLEVVPGGAAVQVDGRPVQTHELTLEAGDHVVTASAPGYRGGEQTVTVEGGRSATASLHLARFALRPAEVAAPSAAATAHPASPPDDSRAEGGLLTKWWFWTAAGIVIAGAAVGTAVALGGRETSAAANKGSSGIALHSF